MSKLRGWAYLAVFIAAVGAGVFLGRWAETNMPDCPGKRFAPSAFGAIFGMIALIVLCGHADDKSLSKDRAASIAPEPHLGTIDSYADFRYDLIQYETGQISLGQFLDRWAGRVPPKRKAAEKASPEAHMADAILGGIANTRLSLSAAPRFRPGQWARIVTDGGREGLAKVLHETYFSGIVWHYGLETAKGRTILPETALVAAFPLKGEWWSKAECPKVHKLPNGVWWAEGPTKWQYSDADPVVCEAVECGCLIPVNWGKGWPAQGSGLAGGSGGVFVE